LNASLKRFLLGLPAKNEDWCQKMVNGELEPIERVQLEGWAFNESEWVIRPPPDEDEMNKRDLTIKEQTTKLN
jgi:hypothetical protein